MPKNEPIGLIRFDLTGRIRFNPLVNMLDWVIYLTGQKEKEHLKFGLTVQD